MQVVLTLSSQHTRHVCFFLPVNVDLEPNHYRQRKQIAHDLNPVTHFKNDVLKVVPCVKRPESVLAAVSILQQKQRGLE